MPQTPKGFEIIKATYGVEQHREDVTKEIKKMIKNDKLDFTVSPNAFGILDPAPGVKKTLQALVSINGGSSTEIQKDDGEQFVINAPTVNKDDTTKKEPINQVISVANYIFIAFIGGALITCFYLLGSQGMGNWYLGVALGFYALLMIISASATSGGLYTGIIISLIISFVMLVFSIAFVNPSYINFTYAKKQVEQAVEAVTAPPS